MSPLSLFFEKRYFRGKVATLRYTKTHCSPVTRRGYWHRANTCWRATPRFTARLVSFFLSLWAKSRVLAMQNLTMKNPIHVLFCTKQSFTVQPVFSSFFLFQRYRAIENGLCRGGVEIDHEESNTLQLKSSSRRCLEGFFLNRQLSIHLV